MDKYLCHRCIDNDYYKDIIKTDGSGHDCSYCGRRRLCLNLEEIARYIDRDFTEEYEQSVEPEIIYDPESESSVEYEYPGDPPNLLLQEILGCEENIIDDLIDVLQDYDTLRAHDGGDVYYDLTTNYLPIHRFAYWRPYEWIAFCNKVKHKARFFDQEVIFDLETNFGNIDRIRSIYGETPIINIGPDNDIGVIYRARKVENEKTGKLIKKKPSEHLGPPPASLTPASRMNPVGIPLFYGALEEDTCISEIRSSMRSVAALGKFEILTNLRILDLTIFNDGLADPGSVNLIVGFHRDISKPVLPRDEILDYIPTQIVSEFLASRVNLNIDGIIYSSAQTGGEGKNIVLFNKVIRDNYHDHVRYVKRSIKFIEVTSISYDYTKIKYDP